MTLENEDIKNCPFCDELISINAKKCKHCGEWLEPKSLNSRSTTIIEVFANQYEVLDNGTQGGMAIVYKARHKNLDRIVALKIIPQEFTFDIDFVNQFKKEAQNVAFLNHTNIVTVYDSGEIMGYPYIEMEFLSGGSLRELIITKTTFSEKEIIDILNPILDGLKYIHGEGFTHRDIKSSNIMFDRKGRPVLMDFGIAKSSKDTDKTLIQAFKGTPEYASPEQVEPNVTIDHRTDIYSLGIVAYEMATGKVPFKGDNPISVLHQVIHKNALDPAIFNNKLSKEFSRIILQAIAKDPGARFQTAGEFSKALNSIDVIVKGKETKQTLKNLEISFWPQIFSNKKHIFIAIIGLLLTLISITAYIQINQKASRLGAFDGLEKFKTKNNLRRSEKNQSSNIYGKEDHINSTSSAQIHTSRVNHITSIEEDRDNGYKKTSSGLLYKFHIDNKFLKFPAIGDFVEIDMIYGTGDSVLFDSKNLPQVMQLPIVKSVYPGDIYEGLSMMNIGDSATFICNTDSVFLKLFRFSEVPADLESVEYIYFYIKMNDIMSKEEMQAKKEAEAQRMAEEEAGLRDTYIAENYPGVKPTESGLYFISEKKGRGKMPVPGEKVKVHYTGKFLDGKVFDSSIERGQPFEFTLGQGQVIKGWDEGIAMMRKGGKAILIIPSDLAYGPQGNRGIPPSSTLLFEVELIDFN